MSSSKEPESEHSQPEQSTRLTHVNAQGNAIMVDVGSKPDTRREAIASSTISMSVAAANAVRNNDIKKGDCIQVARIAAIQASKQTSTLIPLCHALMITSVDVQHEWVSDTELRWYVTVRSFGPTGVEMEALTAASVAALTVYDMCKAVDQAMKISDIVLLSKTGGARGDYLRNE
jgi:cyclic pyranopterin phosphate synthase